MEYYILHPYDKECVATVLSSENNIIEIDNNIFYPNSGGQLNDLGKIDDANVVEVKKESGKIKIKVDKHISAGKRVHCIIDWERRYRLMRMHTASHLLSQILNVEKGALITGNQLGLEKSRIDFNVEKFDRAMFQELESKANEMIRKNIPVESYIVDRAEIERNPRLVKLAKGLPDFIKEVRIVDIKDFDAQACGGTHVKNLGEIKGIKIIDMENKGRGNRRIYFSLVD